MFMAPFVRDLIIASAVCLSVTECSSAVETCSEQDVTSLVQAKSFLSLGNQRQPLNKTCGIDASFAKNTVLIPMLTPIAEAANWEGDHNFMISQECKHMTNYQCWGKSEAKCHGTCQWYPAAGPMHEHCHLLKLDRVTEYAQAGKGSPFDLYTAAEKECNSRSKDACAKDARCRHDPNNDWAWCVVDTPLFTEITCEQSWQLLINSVKVCAETQLASPSTCSKKSCNFDEKSKKCILPASRLYELSYGKEEGKTLQKKMKALKKGSCDNDGGVSKATCSKTLVESFECYQHDKNEAKCNNQNAKCTPHPLHRQCELSPEYFTEICGGIVL